MSSGLSNRSLCSASSSIFLCIDAGGLFNLPLPYPNEGRSARSWSFVAQPAVPIEFALFCRRSSQALSVESPATAPVLRLTPQPSWIATGRFAPPSLGRRRPTDRYIPDRRAAPSCPVRGGPRLLMPTLKALDRVAFPYPAASSLVFWYYRVSRVSVILCTRIPLYRIYRLSFYPCTGYTVWRLSRL